jgi:hypothetical protein
VYTRICGSPRAAAPNHARLYSRRHMLKHRGGRIPLQASTSTQAGYTLTGIGQLLPPGTQGREGRATRANTTICKCTFQLPPIIDRGTQVSKGGSETKLEYCRMDMNSPLRNTKEHKQQQHQQLALAVQIRNRHGNATFGMRRMRSCSHGVM